MIETPPVYPDHLSLQQNITDKEYQQAKTVAEGLGWDNVWLQES